MALEHLSLAGFAHEGASSSRLVRAADAFSLFPLLRASYVPASAMTAGMHYCSCYTHVWEVWLFTLHGILDNSSNRSHWCLPFAPIVAPVFMAHRVQHSHSARRFTSNFDQLILSQFRRPFTALRCQAPQQCPMYLNRIRGPKIEIRTPAQPLLIATSWRDRY